MLDVLGESSSTSHVQSLPSARVQLRMRGDGTKLRPRAKEGCGRGAVHQASKDQEIPCGATAAAFTGWGAVLPSVGMRLRGRRNVVLARFLLNR
jgi:hypothetical protein